MTKRISRRQFVAETAALGIAAYTGITSWSTSLEDSIDWNFLKREPIKYDEKDISKLIERFVPVDNEDIVAHGSYDFERFSSAIEKNITKYLSENGVQAAFDLYMEDPEKYMIEILKR